jgi:hypothetical protein
MTTGSEFRDAIADALYRDLVGPLIDAFGKYPGIDAVEVNPAEITANNKLPYGVLVHPDGGEMLPYPPTARYGIGVLYPHGESVERTIDLDQGGQVDQLINEDGELFDEDGNLGPPSDLDFRDEPEDEQEEPAVRRSFRPSALGISFMLRPDTTQLVVSLSGARYEALEISNAGKKRTLWHRVPVDIGPLIFEVAEGRVTKEQISRGPLTIEVGASCRKPGLTITCFARNITIPPGSEHPAGSCLYQTELCVETKVGTVEKYPNGLGSLVESDDEDATFDLLYKDHPIKAVGHGCDAVFEASENGDTVKSQALPRAEVLTTSTSTSDEFGKIEVEMLALADWNPKALAAISRLIDRYENWIDEKSSPGEGRTADDHLEACRNFLADIREGWQLALTNDDVRRCLCWTSRSMAMQQEAYGAILRPLKVAEDETASVGGKVLRNGDPPTWRSFQIAFLLANLAPTIDSKHKRRNTLDVIWMPTGGGKTEAYLALAAFVMLWRRLRASDKSIGIHETVVMMRYTLRLLTAQQLQRTASLVCALEIIRRDNKEVLGSTRFTVGAWLGQKSTPNRRRNAVDDLQKFKRGSTGQSRPFLLSRCPWCACDFFDQNRNVQGYSIQQLPIRRMQASCPNPECDFHLSKTVAGLPVYEVDEDIYERPPTFLIGTVDKFAMLAWRREGRSFFGFDESGHRVRNGPDLMIQDELHLITGPLGSLVGLYEAGIAALCQHDGGIPPRIIAATATTKAYKKQTRGVFASGEARLLPPPGIRIEDSFFAFIDKDLPPRLYMGICATGLGKFPRTQARVFASLAHAVGVLAEENAESADYYWTNLSFFGSLRDLGTAKTLIATDLRAHQWNLASTTTRSGNKNADGQGAYRFLRQIELTSASSHSATEALDRLLLNRSSPGSADLALATSVVEVGLDIQRLGLLTIVRQPKTTATYIQVSGRVGRNAEKGPGLVIVLFNPSAGRDVSHYERFTSFHQRLYEAVEPATVTPFTDAVLERGLRGVIATVVRQTRPFDIGPDVVCAEDEHLASMAVRALQRRAREVSDNSDGAADLVGRQWSQASLELRTASEQSLPWGEPGPATENAFLRTADIRPGGVPLHAVWPVLTSLRSVDATAGLRIDSDWIRVRPDAQMAIPRSRDLEGNDTDRESEW